MGEVKQQELTVDDINAKFSELQAEKAAIVDGYSLAKAQLKQLSQVAKMLQEQNEELTKERDTYKESHEQLEKLTSPAPKKKRRVKK